MVIIRIFVKRKFLILFFNLFVFSIVVFTLSRTAIITSLIILLRDFIIVVKHKKSIQIWAGFFFGLFLTITLLAFSQFLNEILSTFCKAISAIDLTMSGRTTLWDTILKNGIISLKPQFGNIGSFQFLSQEKVVVDNTLLRLFGDYGLSLLLPLCLLLSFALKQWRKLPEIIKLNLFMLALYSITVDFLHILPVMIPSWIAIGFYFNRTRNKTNIEISPVETRHCDQITTSPAAVQTK